MRWTITRVDPSFIWSPSAARESLLELAMKRQDAGDADRAAKIRLLAREHRCDESVRAQVERILAS